MDEEQKILKKKNRTLFITSRLFSKRIRDDIYKLYSFLYALDNYARTSTDGKHIAVLRKKYQLAVNDAAYESIAHRWDDTDTRIIKYIVRLTDKYKLEPSMVESIFDSFIAESEAAEYKTFDDLDKHLDKSVGNIGSIVSKILKLPEEAMPAVVAQAKAVEWLNYIRSISRDSASGRLMFPKEDLSKYDLKDISHESASAQPEKFTKFIHLQIKRYNNWQSEAEKGISLIPERLQVSIRSAISTYKWMASKIEKDPFIVYGDPIKPRRRRILRQMMRHTAGGTARVTARTGRKARSGIKKVRPATKAVVPKIKQAPSLAKEKTKEIADKYIEFDEKK